MIFSGFIDRRPFAMFRQLFMTHFSLKNSAKSRNKSLDQKTKHLDETRRKFAIGVATEYDVLAAEVAVENGQPETIRTENLIRTSRERLRFLLGLSGQEVDVAGQLYTPIESVAQYEEALKQAYEKRPELAELRNRLGLYKELVTVAGAGNKPRLDLKATTGYRDVFLGNKDNEYDGKTWSVGLIATFPFFDGFRTKGKVAQAQSDVSSLKIEEAKTTGLHIAPDPGNSQRGKRGWRYRTGIGWYGFTGGKAPPDG